MLMHRAKKSLWLIATRLHSMDFGMLLPLMARLPLSVGYVLSALRGCLNGIAGRDWRSMSLGTRHVAKQSAMGYRMLMPDASEEKLRALVRQRFETESREEFEGRLIADGRLADLRCTIGPNAFLQGCLQRDRGLVLLTPHFDSFTLGIAFLGHAGVRINAMASVGNDNSGIDPAVYKHFVTKYRGMERYMNGGRILPLEHGLRPFYQMLERKECLVVLADTPPTAKGPRVTPLFLGTRRSLAGGALKMARKTGSDLGAFVCHFDSLGHYRVEGGPILDAGNPQASSAVYGFLSDAILTSPGRWWAADLLTAMTVVDERS